MHDLIYHNGKLRVYSQDKDGDTEIEMEGWKENPFVWLQPGDVRELIAALRKSIEG